MWINGKKDYCLDVLSYDTPYCSELLQHFTEKWTAATYIVASLTMYAVRLSWKLLTISQCTRRYKPSRWQFGRALSVASRVMTSMTHLGTSRESLCPQDDQVFRKLIQKLKSWPRKLRRNFKHGFWNYLLFVFTTVIMFFLHNVLVFFFFLCWRYNPLWVLGFSAIFFHSVLSLHSFLHPLIPIVWMSSSTSSIHLFLGLPMILLPIGFHDNFTLRDAISCIV